MERIIYCLILITAHSLNMLYLIPTDPPDGSPSCSVEPALNYTSLRLLCSWPGGFPSPSLRWTRDLKNAGLNKADKEQTNPITNTAVLLSTEDLTSNNSLFTCTGSHLALRQSKACSTHTCEKDKKEHFTHSFIQTSLISYIASPPPLTDIPPAEPVCFAYVTSNKQYLILSCSWNGGVPKAMVWWEGPGGHQNSGEENSNILILHYGMAHSGKPYTCHAKHPLLNQSKICRLTLGQCAHTHTHLTT